MWSKSNFSQSCHLSTPQFHLCLAAKPMPQSMAVSSVPMPWAPPGLEKGNRFLLGRGPFWFLHPTKYVADTEQSCHILFLLSPSKYLFPRPRSRIENVLISYSFSVKGVRPSRLTGLMSGAAAHIFSVSTFYFCKQKESLKIQLVLFRSIQKAFSFTF